MQELTIRQNEIYAFIKNHINKNSFPPTFREIADNFSISIRAVQDHIAALKKKGVLKQNGKRSRVMEIVKSNDEDGVEAVIQIPILGTVAAGDPILAEENHEGSISLHHSMLKKGKEHFAVKVRGDSMIGAGIMEGDMAIIEKQPTVSNGEIAVTVIDEAVTLKRFFKEANRIKLQAENPDYKPIYCQDPRILGRLARIVRSY